MRVLLAQSTGLLERLGLNELGQGALRFLIDHAPGLAANLACAVAIFLIGRWLAKIATNLLSKVLVRAQFEETLVGFLSRVTHVLLMLLVAVMALQPLGVDTTTLTALLATAGLAIGLALQGSLSNFASGVMIILFRPFKTGDFIEAGGAKGAVEEIHVFHTLMRTADNVQLIVPNRAITGGNISNYSSKPTRRIDLVVGCGYNDDPRAVKKFLSGLVASDPRILPDPEPIVAVSELGDNSVNFVVRPWVVNEDYWPVRWDLTEAIKVGFDLRGFQIPYPQRDLHIYRESPIEGPDGEPKDPQVESAKSEDSDGEIAGPESNKQGQSSPQFDWFTPRRAG